MTPYRKIILVAGARPNFMKVAPLWREIGRHSGVLTRYLVHTGQHYDAGMSDVFFSDLDLPRPDRFLGVGSGTHAEQTAKVMIAFEGVCLEERPDLVVVVGDVNSTMACAITAKKLCIPVAHVEAGLRSRDWTMPEEVNRIVTDRLSDLLFTPSRDADENLLDEGISREQIRFVGNVMVDTLLAAKAKAEARGTFERLGLEPKSYGLVTLHRPSNVDDPGTLEQVLDAFAACNGRLPLIFPIHPRTRKNLEVYGLTEKLEAIPALRLLDPLGYLDFLNLEMHAGVVLTDSGGIQEETTCLGIACLTLRENTERPVTITQGTNRLVSVQTLSAAMKAAEDNGSSPRKPAPEFWDGHAAERIVQSLL